MNIIDFIFNNKEVIVLSITCYVLFLTHNSIKEYTEQTIRLADRTEFDNIISLENIIINCRCSIMNARIEHLKIAENIHGTEKTQELFDTMQSAIDIINNEISNDFNYLDKKVNSLELIKKQQR